MVQILAVRDLNQRLKVLCKAGLEDSADLHVIAVHNTEGVMNEGAVFRYSGEIGEILWLDMGEDMDLAEGLAKAILNIMEIRGVKIVTLPLTYVKLAQKLRFTRQNNCFEVSLEGYFCCACNHNNFDK